MVGKAQISGILVQYFLSYGSFIWGMCGKWGGSVLYFSQLWNLDRGIFNSPIIPLYRWIILNRKETEGVWILELSMCQTSQRTHCYEGENDSKVELPTSLGSSDHCCVQLLLQRQVSNKKCNADIYVYSKGNYYSMIAELEALNLRRSFKGLCIHEWEAQCILWYNQAEASKICTQESPEECSTKSPRHLSKGHVKIKKKHRARQRYMETGTTKKYMEYTCLRDKIKNIVHKTRRKHIKKKSQLWG